MAKGPQAEYTNLVGYFKHLVWITGGFVTVLIGLAGFLFYSNLKDVREDAKQEATRVATSQSKAAVEKAFEDKNINAQIQKAAEEKIGTITDRMIEQQLASKLKPIEDRIFLIGRISECETRMRMGFRSGLDDLASIINVTKDPDGLRFARGTLSTTSEQFDSRLSGEQKNMGFPSSLAYLNFMFQSQVRNRNLSPPSSAHDVVQIIENDQDLNIVAVAFLAFRELAQDPGLKMFDFAAVKSWCASNGPRCK
jgi:hypothetical protein